MIIPLVSWVCAKAKVDDIAQILLLAKKTKVRVRTMLHLTDCPWCFENEALLLHEVEI